MKHLKRYDENDHIFKVGDYVKCIEEPDNNYTFKLDGNDIKLNGAYIVSELHDLVPKIKVSGIMRGIILYILKRYLKEEYELITTANKYNL